MRRLTTGIRSEKCVVRQFRRCAIILYCNIIILWDHRRICGPSLTETSLCGAWLYKDVAWTTLSQNVAIQCMLHVLAAVHTHLFQRHSLAEMPAAEHRNTEFTVTDETLAENWCFHYWRPTSQECGLSSFSSFSTASPTTSTCSPPPHSHYTGKHPVRFPAPLSSLSTFVNYL